tara:strand:- start:654 stop:941 length:288 start_codon:yes stop_codon:yes gene_type:complete
MSVVVVIDLIAKDGLLEPLIEQLHKILPDTKAYDGCLFLKMAVYEGKNVVALYEEWETKEHQEAYAAWRMENGHESIEPYIETFQATYADVLNTY